MASPLGECLPFLPHLSIKQAMIMVSPYSKACIRIVENRNYIKLEVRIDVICVSLLSVEY